MAAELTTTKLNADAHLLLDQPLVRLPHEFARKNLRSSRALVERFQTETNAAIDSAQKAALKTTHSSSATVASLDAVLNKAQTLKRKLEALHAEERALQSQQKARLRHLQELHEIPSLVDVKFDRWSKVRLDRMLVDYMLRMGFDRSAKLLTQERKIEGLVDVDAFRALEDINRSLRQGRTNEALTWCQDNKRALKEAGSNLELELRLQQMVEMTRTGETTKLIEATIHARKYLGAQQDTFYGLRAGGLLAHPANTLTEPYRELYSPRRWSYLADLFISTYEQIFSLPPQPLLHIALSAGLSALKTPACHSVYASSSSNASSTTTSVCPICSTELNELAKNVPYAHHTKSYVEDNPVVLPNGRIYGRERLMAMNEKLGTAEGKIRDPTNVSQEFSASQMKKVFIT
ncbi:protein fyv10 [Myriangium duriaei CBS 260.36]|uniref:Protein fyv10 n=1 Tax=Myriangium duriaei CBS 260.36 TaxID=1168546 RepID=A0A9P4IYR7_9PEZI|nr:protein fyv10 [Myriangium duriaei CBS 260.36]